MIIVIFVLYFLKRVILIFPSHVVSESIVLFELSWVQSKVLWAYDIRPPGFLNLKGTVSSNFNKSSIYCSMLAGLIGTNYHRLRAVQCCNMWAFKQ